ncbi:cobalamin biosynthesis protein P47K [Blastopirellula sp. JC732]|uniref:Cobalamin biosynthesis protein P47K n=1 Tax=Blastopirellula sediminis TaxID=2894196 RepID=A0A9X1SIJ2_9BACT|nr:GTP-binding protein [Blastopirellula sediminis]MCC9605022.1 cobalamin biosynthesis protein P47K [Blastopirellula sediminis]MCC9631678.1 cobalamin biosynthesis protein P47K [Blastopirellula sediminis]
MSSSAKEPGLIRFVMIGGFLGAGKTTTIGRLAQHYREQGLNVGIVTNDQATDLVDTQLLRSQGFRVGEVAGACFCCNFNELTGTVEKLSAHDRPDVVIAEPVGSCTDLVATVVQPLVQMFDAHFDVAPYGVILKPSHGLRILQGDDNGGFSPKAAYIFKKQLEEADFVIINRIDELEAEKVETLAGLISGEFPGTPILRTSAKTGAGFDALVELIDQRGEFGKKILEIDYDVYAEGEAELGWLNSSLKATAEQAFDLDAFLMAIMSGLQETLAKSGAETAHLKVIGLWEGFYGVANMISSDTEPLLSLPSNCQAKEADVVVNARVGIAPDELRRQVDAAIEAAAKSLGVFVQRQQTQYFRPGRPVPTHRFSDAK